MFLETAEGVVELKEDGTYVKHRVRFHSVGGKVFREDLVAKDIQPVPPSVLLTIDEATGEIEGEQRGFVLDHEFNTPVHPTAGKRYVEVIDRDLPADFKSEVAVDGQEGKFVSVINYKVVAGNLVKKTIALNIV